MKIVVDFDGTLCIGNGKYIESSTPNNALIKRLRDVKNTLGKKCHISIVTARGAKDGLSTIQKKERYLHLIESFCKKNHVPYDSISFNKEYADLYIDDMTIGQNEFFEPMLSKYTKNTIITTEETVIKKCNSSSQEKEWYDKASMILNCPKVLFYNNDCIITSRIKNTTKEITAFEYVGLLKTMQRKKIGEYPFDTYKSYILESSEPYKEKLSGRAIDLINSLPEHEPTFFHGDFSCENVLKDSETGLIYLIDPNVKPMFGSATIDAGKLFFSLVAYDKDFQKAKDVALSFGSKYIIKFAVSEGIRVLKNEPNYISIINNIADMQNYV